MTRSHNTAPGSCQRCGRRGIALHEVCVRAALGDDGADYFEDRCDVCVYGRVIERAPTADERLEEVARLLGGVFGDAYVADDTGGRFNCGEADDIAEAMRVAGCTAEAVETWLAGHAEHDDQGDRHHPEYVAEAEVPA